MFDGIFERRRGAGSCVTLACRPRTPGQRREICGWNRLHSRHVLVFLADVLSRAKSLLLDWTAEFIGRVLLEERGGFAQLLR